MSLDTKFLLGDIAPTGEIRSDGFLTPSVIAPTETAAILPVDAGQELVKCGPVDNRSIPASAFLVSSAASYDTPAPVPSTADLAADCIHCGLITSELVTTPTGMLFQSVSAGLYIDIAPSNAADYMSNRCSMFCCSDFSSMVTTTLSSSTTTWMFAEVIYNFGKRLWLPPPLAPVLSEQGMHKLVVVGPLIDAKQNVIWSKSPWPPPTEWLLHCAIVQLRPIPWPSFDSWNAQCASGQHSEKDMDFVLWILEKSAWPFAKLVCWSSDVCAAMTEITRAHMLRCLSAHCSAVAVIMINISSELCLLILSVANSKGILVDQGIIYLAYLSTDSAHVYCSSSRWLELFQFLSSLHRPNSILSTDGIFGWPQTKILSISFCSSFAEITIPLTFIVGETMKGHILQVAVHAKSAREFLNLWQYKQCLVALLSYSVNCCWVQWEIPWLTSLQHADFWQVTDGHGCKGFRDIPGGHSGALLAIIENHTVQLQHLVPYPITLLTAHQLGTQKLVFKKQGLVPLSSSILLIYYVLTQKHADGSWGYIPGGLLHSSSTSSHGTKLQVTKWFSPLPIAELLFRSPRLCLLAAFFMEIKINNVTSIRQAPWDPGGMDILHRLEGKPIVKEERMSGHYLSATAKMGASTHNATLAGRMAAVVDALHECQRAAGTGYLSAFPALFFDKFEAVVYVWAPYYTIHKIMQGLLDQHVVAGNGKALGMVVAMADYFAGRVANVIRRYSIERHWASLNEETGGMNDVLYQLYTITKDQRHLVLAHLFDKPCFLGLLALKVDSLSDFHANTHIPLVVGGQMRYEVTGDPLYKEIATFFMDTVNSSHAYATGGTSVYEFWSDPKRLAGELNSDTQESCTTYNMLKVSRNLFRWTKEIAYADYYERALINGVLSIQRGRDPGVMIYLLPQGPGSSKSRSTHSWGTPYNSFWCCYGTGIESFSKLGDSIYFEEKVNIPALYIIQFIPSRFKWRAAGLTVTQKLLPLSSSDQYLQVLLLISAKCVPRPFSKHTMDAWQVLVEEGNKPKGKKRSKVAPSPAVGQPATVG